MKDLFKSGVIVLLVIGVLYIIFLRECKRPDPCPPEGMMLIKISEWDSIKAVAQMKPIVKIDTVWLKGDIIYVDNPLPPAEPDPKDTTVNHYSDSLVKKDVDVHIKYSIRGELISRQWSYRPVTQTITIDSIIYKPYPVEVEKLVYVPRGGLYGHAAFGGNADAFIFGGGLDVITKNDTQFGYLYQRFGKEDFHSIKIGARLFKRKN